MLTFCLSAIGHESDKRTFEQIYRKYDARLCRLVGKYLTNSEDIKDAMQNTWLGVLKKMDLCREMDENELKSYIMTIAKNQAVSIARKNQKEWEMFVDADETELPDDRDLFELCEAEDISDISKCLDMLSEKQREVITMHYLYHHSLKEIAELFGIPESIVESRWKNGRARLIQLLQRKEIYAKKEKDGT